MPYKLKDRNKWRGAVMVDGNRVVKDFETKKEAKAWEEGAKDRLRNLGSIQKQADTDYVSLADKYLDYCKDRNQIKTYRDKANTIYSFNEYIGKSINIKDIDESVIADYLSTIKNKISTNTANVHRKNLSAFWNWLRKYHGIKYNPVSLVDKFPYDTPLQYTPPEADVLKVLTAAQGQDQIFIETYIQTGARKSEVFRLMWTDINFEKKQIRLGTRKTRDKSMSYTWLHLNDHLAGRLLWLFKNRKYKESQFVFVNDHPSSHKCGHPFQSRDKFMKRICMRANVKPFGFHALRRFSASLLADKFKQSMPTIQKILRHANVTTTERYVQAIEAGQSFALDALGEWIANSQNQPVETQSKESSKKQF